MTSFQRLSVNNAIEQVLNVLPQTQCEECGYKGCRPYAEAVLQGEDVGLCAPGGLTVAKQLERMTKGSYDHNQVQERYTSPKLAEIDQGSCIGCTKCIAPCPTEAIVGARKLNHYVLASDCTGCGLCVDYCPVDCITMVEDHMTDNGKYALRSEYRELYDKKNARPKHRVGVRRQSILNDLMELKNESE